MEKNSLANSIASILTSAPAHFDSEDEDVDDTKATLISDFEDDDNDDLPIQGSFRKQNIDLLADVDERYAGKEGSRKTLNSDEEISSPVSDFNSDEEDEIDNDDEYEDLGSDESGSVESGSDGEDVIDIDDQDGGIANFKTMKDVDVSQQVKKGTCVKNQMSIWENLLEMRIQVQKCLVPANKMPQGEKYKEIKNDGGQEFSKGVQEAKKSISELLEKFLMLQSLLWKQYPEMKKFKSKKLPSENADVDENEEIPSDTENETDEEEEEDTEEVPRKKMKIADFEKEIADKHNFYKDYRNSVIQKWNDKTRMPLLKNNTNTHSIINHIEHTLADKVKLIKRTQMKRSDYKIIGEDTIDTSNENQEAPPEEYNTEIFDDTDFYHQLLRELIEVKSADLTDPIQLGKQWMQLQTLRSKMKRKIDTKATKGRKIRYAVHTKLVNYMAPIDNSSWSDEAKTELFSSLFGKNQVSVS